MEKKVSEKVEGDPALVAKFADRLRTLEKGAAPRDVEMAANALALKYHDEAAVSDKEVVEMYGQRIAARPGSLGEGDVANG